MVSVIIAAWGCEKYISSTLRSLQKQAYKDWEAIVIDDGSPDNVGRIVEKFAAEDKRIHFIHTDNNGVAAARNHAASQSKGKYILPLDGDDMIHSTYIAKCVEILDNNPEVAVVYCNWVFFGSSDKTPKLIYKGYEEELLANFIFNCAMFRRKDFEEIGGFDVEMRDGCEDWEMWIRLLDPARKCHEVVQIPEPPFFYRQKEHSYNPKRGDDRLNRALDYIYAKHEGLYRRFFGPPILMAERFYIHWRSERDKRVSRRPHNRIIRLAGKLRFKRKPKLPVED